MNVIDGVKNNERYGHSRLAAMLIIMNSSKDFCCSSSLAVVSWSKL
jgi:hypothetical protein